MKQKRVLSPAVRAMVTDIAVLLLCTLFFGLLLYAPLTGAEEAFTPEEEALSAACRRGEIVRLHILADSDSPKNQRIKYQVRDAVLAAFGQKLKQAGEIGFQEAWQLLQMERSAMETVARCQAQSLGFTGQVTAEAGLLRLPEKKYGRVTLPEGVYHGLRIVLGSGQGQNWWCVLFPQLCLALADDEPWKAAPEKQAATREGADTLTKADDPTVVWDSARILNAWLLLPGDSTAPKVAANVVDAEQNQRQQNAAKEHSGHFPVGLHP